MNTLNHILTVIKRIRSGTTADPVRDWLTVLTITGIILAGIVTWNVWAFDTIANGGDIGTAVPATPPSFNRASLETIHTIFVNRATEEAKYATGVYRYTDPSQ